jgi:hypothetical protein
MGSLVVALARSAYALHPAFAEARVMSLDVGLRPAFADNLARIIIKGRTIRVNGLFRMLSGGPGLPVRAWRQPFVHPRAAGAALETNE